MTESSGGFQGGAGIFGGVIGAIAIAIIQFPSFFSSSWEGLVSREWGNFCSAIVFVSGYILESWRSRRDEQRLANINRVTAQMQGLLLPIATEFNAIFLGSTVVFVDRNLSIYGSALKGGMNVIHSDNFKRVMANLFLEDANDLKVQGASSYLICEVMFADPKAATPLACGLPTLMGLAPRVTSPTELPEFLHRSLAQCKKPRSDLWASYERFIRFEFYPGVERIAQIITDKSSLLEPVPPERLAALFGTEGNGFGQKWALVPRMWFYSIWLAYARSWKSVLAMWDQEDYTEIRPAIPFPIGLLMFNMECMTMVSKLEKRLVGMSAMAASDPNTH